MQKRISTLFPLSADAVTAVLTLCGLVAMVAAVFFGEPNWNNPFALIWVYLTVTTGIRILTSNFENFSDAEMKSGFTFGPLNILTGIVLGITHLPMNDLLDSLSVSAAAWLIIDGLGKLVISSALLALKYRQHVAKLSVLNELARIEQESARKWEEQEAERKQKAMMEAELVADLTAFLEDTDSHDGKKKLL